MRIESVRIQNFRGFRDETVRLSPYTCLVGRNGSGKSTVLYALNVFFRETKDSKTDLVRLSREDFHHKNVDAPVRITVTFSDLSEQARIDLKDYVRQDKLIVSAVAEWDERSASAQVVQYGTRMGIDAFRRYFEAYKAGESAARLKEIFAELGTACPDLGASSTTKDGMRDALRQYEEEHPQACTEIPSEDQFYGVSRGKNRLDPHLQWVFVAAAKDVVEEADEARDSALGGLLARTVRSKIDFASRIDALKQTMEEQYKGILDDEQTALDELSESLEAKLRDWAHPQATASVLWHYDSSRTIRIEEPSATTRLGERGFSGELARFGLGLQRSYLLALLQELATLGTESQPTLVMAIEEPELYQHPPQARYLAELLQDMSLRDTQVLCCTHSPLFIPGDDFESVRLVCATGEPSLTTVAQADYQALADTLARADQPLLSESAMLVKLAPSLNPLLSEMFFCSRLVLVEGTEDLAHIEATIELEGLKHEFRRVGCHVVPTGGKSAMIRPLAVALSLGLPTFAVFDADTNKTKDEEVAKHRKENRSLQLLLGVEEPNDWPDSDVMADNYCMWSTNLTDVVAADVPHWADCRNAADARYDHCGGLKKNPLAIAYCHEKAAEQGESSPDLTNLVRHILDWAKLPHDAPTNPTAATPPGEPVS